MKAAARESERRRDRGTARVSEGRRARVRERRNARVGLLLLVAIFAAALAAQTGGSIEGRFSTQVKAGGNQFAAAADFERPPGAP